MKNARQILEEFTASSFRDPRKTAEMFAEDGAFEMPYLSSLGFPWRYEGREKVERFFEFVRDLYPDMDFHDVKVVCETRRVVIGEYEFTTKSSKTGRVIHQLFVGRLEAEKGHRAGNIRWPVLFVVSYFAAKISGLSIWGGDASNSSALANRVLAISPFK